VSRPGNLRSWARGLRYLALPLLVGLLISLAGLQRQGQADHGEIMQIHHGYIGAVVMFAAPLLLSISSAPWMLWVVIVLQLLGTWWTVDDIYQHMRQFEEPFYRSPWHEWAHSLGLI
jgi:hypothetical protein